MKECGWCSCLAPGLFLTPFFRVSALAERSEDTSACWVIFSWLELFLLRQVGETRWAGDGSAPVVQQQAKSKAYRQARKLSAMTSITQQCVRHTVNLVAWRKQTNVLERNPSPVSVVKFNHDTPLSLFLTRTSCRRQTISIFQETNQRSYYLTLCRCVRELSPLRTYPGYRQRERSLQ